MPIFIIEDDYDAKRKITPEYVIDEPNPKEAAMHWAKYKTGKPATDIRVFCHSVDGDRFNFWFATSVQGGVWVASTTIYSAYLLDGPREWPTSDQLKETPTPSQDFPEKEASSFWQRCKAMFG